MGHGESMYITEVANITNQGFFPFLESHLLAFSSMSLERSKASFINYMTLVSWPLSVSQCRPVSDR